MAIIMSQLLILRTEYEYNQKMSYESQDHFINIQYYILKDKWNVIENAFITQLVLIESFVSVIKFRFYD